MGGLGCSARGRWGVRSAAAACTVHLRGGRASRCVCANTSAARLGAGLRECWGSGDFGAGLRGLARLRSRTPSLPLARLARPPPLAGARESFERSAQKPDVGLGGACGGSRHAIAPMLDARPGSAHAMNPARLDGAPDSPSQTSTCARVHPKRQGAQGRERGVAAQGRYRHPVRTARRQERTADLRNRPAAMQCSPTRPGVPAAGTPFGQGPQPDSTSPAPSGATHRPALRIEAADALLSAVTLRPLLRDERA